MYWDDLIRLRKGLLKFSFKDGYKRYTGCRRGCEGLSGGSIDAVQDGQGPLQKLMLGWYEPMIKATRELFRKLSKGQWADLHGAGRPAAPETVHFTCCCC